MYFWNKCILIELGYQIKSINIYWVIAMKESGSTLEGGKGEPHTHLMCSETLQETLKVPQCKRQRKQNPGIYGRHLWIFYNDAVLFSEVLWASSVVLISWWDKQGQGRALSQGHTVTERQSWIFHCEWMFPGFGVKLPGTNCWMLRGAPCSDWACPCNRSTIVV